MGERLEVCFVLPADNADVFSIASETLWCQPEPDGVRLLNIPLFLENVSLMDVVSIESLGAEGYQVQRIVEESGNSTIWLLVREEEEGHALLDKLQSLGCGIEGGSPKARYAINVPKNVSIKPVLEFIDRAEDLKVVDAAYPALRHQE